MSIDWIDMGWASLDTLYMVGMAAFCAAPLMLNPHLVQVVAVSGFLVPQFGQNKSASER